MTSPSNQPSHSSGQFAWLPRPAFQLRALPFRYRWEVSRRHPYYQDWWRFAKAHHRQDPVTDERELLLRPSAVAILGSIGVAGEPPDPATEFEQLDSAALNAGWLSGAVHPMTLRGMAALLIAALPRDIVGLVGLRFMTACREEEGEGPSWTHQAIEELQRLQHPRWIATRIYQSSQSIPPPRAEKSIPQWVSCFNSGRQSAASMPATGLTNSKTICRCGICERDGAAVPMIAHARKSSERLPPNSETA